MKVNEKECQDCSDFHCGAVDVSEMHPNFERSDSFRPGLQPHDPKVITARLTVLCTTKNKREKYGATFYAPLKNFYYNRPASTQVAQVAARP